MATLILGRASSTLTIVPYPTIDTLVQQFEGHHIGMGYFRIRLAGTDIYLDREEPDVAAAVGPVLGQEGQRRIYSAAMGADELAGALRRERPELDIEVRDCNPWAEVMSDDCCPASDAPAAIGTLLSA